MPKSNKEKITRETKFIRGMGKVLILLANQANKRGYFDKDEQETLKRDIESRKTCPNCGQQIDRPVENAEEKLKMATTFEAGKGIYYSILDKQFRSINLCNWCYTIMQVYRKSLSKEEREYKEKKGASNSSQH